MSCSIEGCGREVSAKGLCGRHYQRQRKHGDVNAGIGLRAPLEERFWRFVDRRAAHECWPWTGSRNQQGYGHMSNKTVPELGILAHRISYWIHYRILPNYSSDAVIMHSCDNPWCVNPLHLSAGTHFENAMDMVLKGRQPYTGKKGEAHKGAKLTDEAVRHIRVSTETRQALAERYGVNPRVITQVRLRKAWTHVT